MADELKKPEQKSSAAPFIIIGLIALATVIGIYMVSQSGGDDPGVANNNAATNTDGQTDPYKEAREKYANASAGATPPNSLGSDAAAVVVEEFADFQCPTCGIKHPIIKEVINQYGNKIKFVFRNYPLTNIHKHAYDAAVAAEAAGMQGKFWQMQEMIFVNQGNWSSQANARQMFKDYAEKIGLDTAKFENETLGIAAKTRVDADMQRGNAIGIQSTPTVLINGIAVPYEQMTAPGLRTLIDAEIQRVTGGGDKAEADSEKSASNSNEAKPE
jgi:protein-disulfide isomerase